MGSNIGLPGLPEPDMGNAYVPPEESGSEGVASPGAGVVSEPGVSAYAVVGDQIEGAEVGGALSSGNVPDPAAPQIPVGAKLSPVENPNQSIENAIGMLSVEGQLMQQMQARLNTAFNQAAANLRAQEGVEEEAPPNATEEGFQQWASSMEEEILAGLKGQGSAVAYENASSKVGGDAWYAGTSQTALGIAMMELANALRDMAGAEAAMAILMRQAIREVVAEEMRNIIEEGDLKAEMYRKKAVVALVTACATFAIALAGAGASMKAARAKTATGEAKYGEADRTAISHFFSAVGSSVGKTGEAANNFIDAEYADDLALVDSKKELYRMQKEAVTQAREDELRRIGDDHAEQAKALDILNSYYSSQHGVSISSRN